MSTFGDMKFIAAANNSCDDRHHHHDFEQRESSLFLSQQNLDNHLAVRFQNIIRFVPKLF